jgi:hypothetical protein
LVAERDRFVCDQLIARMHDHDVVDDDCSGDSMRV